MNNVQFDSLNFSMGNHRIIGSDGRKSGLFFSRESDRLEVDLESIITNIVEPNATRFFRDRFHAADLTDSGTSSSQDILDLVGDVRVAMIAVLRTMTQCIEQGPIDSIAAYTVTVARNKYHEYLRKKYPNRFRLKNQLRYILSRSPKFELTELENLGSVCGLASSFTAPDGETPPETAALNPLRNLDTQMVPLAYQHANADLLHLTELVLKELGQPVVFDDLVSLISNLRGTTEPVMSELVDNMSVISTVKDPLELHDQKAFLERVWKAVIQLPLRHRIALLLHLADDRNDNLLMMFVISRIASVRMIAEAVEMQPEELADIWDRLPLPDSEIAQIMDIQRQQVINLRQSARKALKRLLSE